MNSFFSDGRVERVASTLANEHEVKVFGLSDETKNYPNKFHNIPIELIKLKTKKLSKNPFIQIFKYIEYYFQTTKSINKFNPDLIYCNDVFTVYFGKYLKNRGVKFIYDSHELWSDSNHHQERSRKLFKILDKVEKISIKKADAVISVGSEILNILKKRYNLKKTMLLMNIPERIDKQNNNTSNNYIEILYLGAILQGRGLENIIRSSKLWNNGIHLTIIGDGPIREDLIVLVKELNLAHKISIPGAIPQKEVMIAFSNCDAGIHAIENTCLNHYYCLPNKFFQITQSQKPILASNFPEMKKIIDNYNLGYTFDPSSPKNIALVVNQFVEEKFKVSEEDYKRYTNDFSWKNEQKKLLDLVSSL